MKQDRTDTSEKADENRIEILKDAYISPELIETRLGKVEIDITRGDGPVLMGSHGGLGGVDQCRAAIDFAGTYFRLSLSFPPVDLLTTVREAVINPGVRRGLSGRPGYV